MNPIVVSHDPAWKRLFEAEQEDIRRVLGDMAIAIDHIGSTSIPDILAKPIIDMLIEVDSLDRLDEASPAMMTLGYEVMGEFGIEGRRFFRKDTAAGERTHHAHAFESGSDHLVRHLAFRDYLIAHPSKAHDYSQLKAELLASEHSTIETYIEGKNPFIKTTEADALTWARSNP